MLENGGEIDVFSDKLGEAIMSKLGRSLFHAEGR
jgi:hypothetical protein